MREGVRWCRSRRRASNALRPRVDLVPLSGAAIACLLDGRREHAARRLGAAIPAGWPDADDRSLLELRLQDIRRDPAAEPWLLFAIVRREPVPLMVGHAGFHGPPGVNGRDLPAALELAYTVFAPHRRRGYAREAVAALVHWARSVHGIQRFLASIAPGNEPSMRVVTSIGFVGRTSAGTTRTDSSSSSSSTRPPSSAREARNRRSSHVHAPC